MPTDAMEMDDGPDMDAGSGYYSDNNDNTTPKSHLAARRVSITQYCVMVVMKYAK